MDIAAFVMALLALIASTVSITLQVITLNKAKVSQAIPLDPFQEDFEEEEAEMVLPVTAAPVQDRDSLAAIELIRKEELRRMDELFSNPDTPYTGIDEEFST